MRWKCLACLMGVVSAAVGTTAAQVTPNPTTSAVQTEVASFPLTATAVARTPFGTPNGTPSSETLPITQITLGQYTTNFVGSESGSSISPLLVTPTVGSVYIVIDFNLTYNGTQAATDQPYETFEQVFVLADVNNHAYPVATSETEILLTSRNDAETGFIPGLTYDGALVFVVPEPHSGLRLLWANHPEFEYLVNQ